MSDDFYYDEGFPFDIELYNDLEGTALATGSNSDFASGSSAAASSDFQLFLVLALGVLAGILIVGLKGVLT